MSDPYFKVPSNINAPAAHAVSVTTSDSANQATTFKALYIGGAGDVKVELAGDADGTYAVFKNVPAGALLPIRARKIWATGTSATFIVGMY